MTLECLRRGDYFELAEFRARISEAQMELQNIEVHYTNRKNILTQLIKVNTDLLVSYGFNPEAKAFGYNKEKFEIKELEDVPTN